MIKEFERVILNTDIPEFNLEKGDIGTVVMIHDNGAGYEVEFITLDGTTVAIQTLSANQIRMIKTSEIAHVRDIAALKAA
jgi:hypothetical protein